MLGSVVFTPVSEGYPPKTRVFAEYRSDTGVSCNRISWYSRRCRLILPQRINDRGTADKQRVGGAGVPGEIGVQAGSQVVQRVANAGRGYISRAEQGLRPKPDREDNSRHHQPKQQTTPRQ